MIPTRFCNLPAARARFGDQVDRLAPYLLRGDPLADAVAEAFAALPRGAGFALLERALTRGLEAVPEAPDALVALLAEVERVPPWVDWATLDRGGELLLRAGLLGGIVLGAGSIVLGYASPGGNKPLALSGRLKEQAARRLHETSRFVQAVCRAGGMRREGDGFAITVKVRLMHAEVRRMILRSGRWDEGQWGLPINQHDMAATTLLFSLAVLEGLRSFGMTMDPGESEDYTQLWRYVGHVMGCDPELTPASERQARHLADLIRATQGPPDDDSRALATALFDSPLSAVKSPKEERGARLRRKVGHAAAHHLLGAELATALGIPSTSAARLIPLVRGLTLAADRLRGRSPEARREAVRAGERYWDRVVEVGLAGATAEFRPPERLAGSPH